MDNYIHGEVIDDDGLHNFHEELGLVWLRYWLTCLVLD